MTFIEFIGFIITMLAFFFLVIKQARDERKRRQNPELYEEEEKKQQEAVRDLLKSLHIEVPEESLEDPAKPPPPPKIEIPEFQNGKPRYELSPLSQIKAFRDPYTLSKKFEHEMAYEKRIQQRSDVKKLLREPDTLKQAVVLKEILGTPKGLL